MLNDNFQFIRVQRYGLILFFIIVLGGCSTNHDPNKLPPHILPPDTMQNILCDIHLAEAALNHTVPKKDKKTKAEQYYGQVFTQYNITYQQFLTSYNYYVRRPKKFEEMYIRVLEQLSKRKAK